MKAILWLVLVGMIEPLSSTLTPSSNTRRCFKKSWDHHFCDHLETVILSADLLWLLKEIQGAPEIKPYLTPHLSHKCTQISENGKERVQPISRELFLVKNFFTRRLLRNATFKIQRQGGSSSISQKKSLHNKTFLNLSFLFFFFFFFFKLSALNKSFN